MFFLNKHTFFSSNQFGFRFNMSAINTFTKTSHFIYNNVGNKFKVLRIFLDFKKAFDSVGSSINMFEGVH